MVGKPIHSHRGPECQRWRSRETPQRSSAPAQVRTPRPGEVEACSRSTHPGRQPHPQTELRSIFRQTPRPSRLLPGSRAGGSKKRGTPSTPGRSPQPGSPLRPTEATKGRAAAWPLSDSRHRKDRFTSSIGDSEVAGTAACTRGRSAPATPRDVADRTGAKGPERTATENMAAAAPKAKPVTGTTNLPRRRRERRRTRDVSAQAEEEPRPHTGRGEPGVPQSQRRCETGR